MMRRHCSQNIWIIFHFIVCSLPVVFSWHGFGNEDWHCWDLTASAANTLPLTTCDGIDVRWINTPGESIVAQEEFNMTFELVIQDTFYTWAVTNGYFSNIPGNMTAAEAKTWCHSTTCPAANNAKITNCCVWHVNVHSCPLKDTAGGLCGPWIQPSGATFTHSDVIVGPVDTGNWTCHVAGLYSVGVTSIIAHFKIAGMQLALEVETTVMPRAECGDGQCEGLEGEDCESCPKDCGKCPLNAWQIALIAVFTFLVVAGIVGALLYFQYQRRKMLWDESWIIPYDEIRFDDGLKGAFGSMMASTADLSQAATDGTASMAASARGRQVFAQTAMYKMRTCAVKDIHNRQFYLSKIVRREVRAVRECDHANLCKFVGASVVAPDVCILTEYCPKGSLGDVLQNDEVPLNWSFRFSFASDIARGMNHLHSHKIHHGRLKSNNCVVDDRWTVKVTDFGLETMRKHDKHHDEEGGHDAYYDDDEMSYQEKRALIYRAPEFLNIKEDIATPSGDVYAFAIILIEIGTRNDPYGDEDAFSVPHGWKPPLPDLSPEMAEDKEDVCPCPMEYTQLIDSCWDIDPDMRPTFEVIKKSIHRINPSKLSPVDLMMAMMEKYSKHLESIVSERTQDLVAEKAKTDRLLYSMLPKCVADDLRVGRSIKAEIHEACTIYFSDIVGFTTISGASTPIQVVGLLNKLYITFDEIIDKYDVYKVETIGDAYMVVSGIPEATVFHAREIADMSIDLVNACLVFTIPHMPGHPLKIRVGLHSGSACAGVVGLKMPRYCLFGDTVNTASRMESNGEAYKIHISNFTYVELVQFGKYDLEKRGTIPVKGKGDMLTWWLNGHDPNFVKFKESQDTKQPEDANQNSLVSMKDSKARLNNSKCSMTGPVVKQLFEDKLNEANLEISKAPNGHGQFIKDTITGIAGDIRKDIDNIFTPVELPCPDKNTESRKISKVSNVTTDSGYTDKSEDTSTFTERADDITEMADDHSQSTGEFTPDDQPSSSFSESTSDEKNGDFTEVDAGNDRNLDGRSGTEMETPRPTTVSAIIVKGADEDNLCTDRSFEPT